MIGAFFLALVYAAALLGAGLLLGGWLAGVVRMTLERSRLDPEVRYLITSAVRPLVLLVAVVAALGSLGVDLSAVIVLLGVAALTVGLALRETLANGAAGALLLTWRPWRTGDVVEAAGERGVVVDTTLFATTLKTAAGVLVTVPNRLVLDRPVRNHTRNGVTRIEVVVHDARPVEVALATLRDALAQEPRLLAEPPPEVRVEALEAGSAVLVAHAWVATESAESAKAEILRRAASTR